jgi:hypothetical protein
MRLDVPAAMNRKEASKLIESLKAVRAHEARPG